jgi:hypothetical protein
MTNETGSQKSGGISLAKKIGIGAAILVAVFLLGYVPSWNSARTARQQNAQLEYRLNLTTLLTQLGMANFEVNRNNYASAASYSTEFFNGLRETVNRTEDDSLKQKLQTLLGRRDDVTAKLAEANPVVKETVAQSYADFFQIVKDLPKTS